MDKINVTRSSMPSYEEYIEKIKPLWDTRWLTNCGSLHNELEKELEEYLGVNNVILCNNGHMSLYNAIKSLNLTGEVITTPFTFVSTTNAIVQNGLTPVFCDINPVDYTIDVDKIEILITDKTSAIVGVHVYGNVCDVEKIQEIADKHNLKVIYDGAHAFGVKYKGIPIGNFGDVTMMSFHATKVFHTIEGGAVLTNDASLRQVLEYLRNFGLVGTDECDYVGMNTKMNEFQAAMGLCNLKYIDGEIEKRKNIVMRYQNNLSNLPGIECWKAQPDVEANYIYFPILIDEKYGVDRNQIIDALQKNNIFARKYFFPITSEFNCYKDYSGTTPIALMISKKVLTLPLYADLTFDEVDKICNIIKKRVKTND